MNTDEMRVGKNCTGEQQREIVTYHNDTSTSCSKYGGIESLELQSACVCVCGCGCVCVWVGGCVCVPFSTFESWHKFQRCPQTPKLLQISSGTGPEGVGGFL